jgi:protoporphyrinogen oxidase
MVRSDIVGGLARTEDYKGFFFDPGGHRFFTKSTRSKALAEVLGAISSGAGCPHLLPARFFYYPCGPERHVVRPVRELLIM